MDETIDFGNTLDDASILRLQAMSDQANASRVNVIGGADLPRRARPFGSLALGAIQFYNDSGDDAPPFAVMRVTGKTDTSTAGGGAAGDPASEPILKITKPDTTFGFYVVNGPEPVGYRGYGSCFTGGDLKLRYDAGTPVAGQGQGVKPGQWESSQGFPEIGRVDCVHDAANKICFAECGPVDTLIARLTAAVDANVPSTDYKIYANGLDAGFGTVPVATAAVDLGSGTWAILKFVGDGWAILPYANLIWHVTFGSTVAGGSSGSVTLPDGRTVTYTNQSNTTINAADRGSVYEDVTDQLFYSTGGGTGSTPDNMAIVTVNGADTDGNCLWPGVIASHTTTNSHCSDAFTYGASCYLVVLNANLGSASSLAATLTVGEHYIGRHVGDFDNGDDTFTPIYAIRIEENEIYHYKILSPGNIADGATLNVTLLDGRMVTVHNKTGVTLLTDDEVEVYHDLEAKAWYFIKSGGGGKWHRVSALLNGNLYPLASPADVDGIITFDGSTAPAITTAVNFLGLAGCDNEECILEWLPSVGGWDDAAAWIVITVEGKFRRRVKGVLQSDLFGSDTDATVGTITTFDNSTAPTITTAANFLNRDGDVGAEVILEEITTASPSTWFVADVEETVHFARFITFNLAHDMHWDDTSSDDAQVGDWWGGGEDPGPTVTVHNPDFMFHGFFRSTLGGSPGVAIWDDVLDGYLIVALQPQSLFLEGTLASSLAAGSAPATVTADYQGHSIGTPWTVYDNQGLFASYGAGDKFKAVWDDVALHYKIITVQPAGGTFRGTLGATLSFSTTNVLINDVTGCATADNPMHYTGLNGAKVFVTKVSGTWEITGVEQRKIPAVTDVLFNGAKEYEQQLTLVGMHDDDPSDKDVWIGTICEAVDVPGGGALDSPPAGFSSFASAPAPLTFGGF